MKLIRSLILIIAVPLLSLMAACNNSGQKPEAKVLSGPAEKIEVSIQGMSCTGCEQTIQSGISKLEGVTSVKADYKKGMADIVYYPEITDTASIRSAITSTGYIVKGFHNLAEPDSVR